MKKENKYKQVELTFADGATEVSWLPSKLAVVGKVVVIDNYPTKATVTKAYSIAVGEDYFENIRNARDFASL